MAILLTLGPLLLFAARGAVRSVKFERGWMFLGLICLSVAPALAFQLLVHFGVPGYAFHEVPALLALGSLGLPPAKAAGDEEREFWRSKTVRRGLVCASILAAFFLWYPADFRDPGRKGDFDLAFARLTRVGLASPNPERDPKAWRTVNSQSLPGDSGKRATVRRGSIGDLLRF
jgi:hypothetical protein